MQLCAPHATVALLPSSAPSSTTPRTQAPSIAWRERERRVNASAVDREPSISSGCRSRAERAVDHEPLRHSLRKGPAVCRSDRDGALLKLRMLTHTYEYAYVRAKAITGTYVLAHELLHLRRRGGRGLENSLICARTRDTHAAAVPRQARATCTHMIVRVLRSTRCRGAKGKLRGRVAIRAAPPPCAATVAAQTSRAPPTLATSAEFAATPPCGLCRHASTAREHERHALRSAQRAITYIPHAR